MALTDKLIEIGNAIREKTNSSELIPLSDMPSAIRNISSGIEPLDHTVTFTVEGEPYEVVSVNDGNSVNAPSGTPTSEEGDFGKWSLNGERVSFPFIPTEDTEFIAEFSIMSTKLYERFGVNQNEYPNIVIYLKNYSTSMSQITILFIHKDDDVTNNDDGTYIKCSQPVYRANKQGLAGRNPMTIGEIVNYFDEQTSITVTKHSAISEPKSDIRQLFSTNTDVVELVDNATYFK